MSRCTCRDSVADFTVVLCGLAILLTSPLAASQAGDGGLRVAAFVADITPPVGEPLVGGFCRPVATIEHPLLAKGVVLQDARRHLRALLSRSVPPVQRVVRPLSGGDRGGGRHVARARRSARGAAAHGGHPRRRRPAVARPAGEAACHVHPAVSRRGDPQHGGGRAPGDEAASSGDPRGHGLGRGRSRGLVAADSHARRPDRRPHEFHPRPGAARACPKGVIDPKLRTVVFFDGPTPLAYRCTTTPCTRRVSTATGE